MLYQNMRSNKTGFMVSDCSPAYTDDFTTYSEKCATELLLCLLRDVIVVLNQQLHYVSFNNVWMCTGIVTFHWFAIPRHQKLLKVPAYITHFEWRIEEAVFACKSIPCRGAVFLEAKQ
jgi:hypothetical protein